MAFFLLGHKNRNGSRTGAQIIISSLACCSPPINLSQLQLTQCQLHESPCRASQSVLMLLLRHTEKIPAAFSRSQANAWLVSCRDFPSFSVSVQGRSWTGSAWICSFRVIPVNGLWLCSLWAHSPRKKTWIPQTCAAPEGRVYVRQQSSYQLEDFGIGFGRLNNRKSRGKGWGGRGLIHPAWNA